jgi:hypothetical protein
VLELALTVALALPHEEQRVPPPDPQRVAEAVRALETAFKQGTPEERIEAVRAQGSVADAEVVEWLAKALARSKEPELQGAAIEALRFQEHPDALGALETSLRRDRALRDAPQLYGALIKAVGQHGHERSIDLLTDDLWSVRDEQVVQARILALGHIRSPKSAEALFSVMKVAGRQRVQQRMPELRLALIVLLGVDQGDSQDAWMAWWNDHKGALVVPPEEPPLPRLLAQRWANHWGRAPAMERPRKRGDRGRE